MKSKVFSILGKCVASASMIVSLAASTQGQSLTFGANAAEVGLTIGPSTFLGDVGGNKGKGATFLKDFNPQFTYIMKGAYAVIYPTDYVGARVGFTTGKVEGHDEVIKNTGTAEYYRYIRNQGFRSGITEGYAALEVYPTVFLEQFDGVAGKFRPFGIIGGGFFKFRPQGVYIDPELGTKSWVDLAPLRLEGQGMEEYPDRKEYSLTQFFIPMGMGFKYYLSERFYVGMEIIHRKTFTDYVDDVSKDYIDPSLFDKYLPPSQAEIAKQVVDKQYFMVANHRTVLGDQRGNPKNNDAYFSTNLKLGIRFSEISAYERRIKKRSTCPKF